MHYSLQICSWISVKAIANFILIASVAFTNRFAAEEEARKKNACPAYHIFDDLFSFNLARDGEGLIGRGN